MEKKSMKKINLCLDVNFIVSEYFDKEKTLLEIGELLGCSSGTIRNILLRNGYVPRRKHPLRIRTARSKIQKSLWKNPHYRKNMSLAHIGNIPWNKGLTKETDERMHYDIPTRFKKGVIPWSKGLKATSDTKLKMANIKMVKKRKSLNNYICKDETKKKISLALKGVKKKKSHSEKVRLANLGKKRSAETRAKLKETRKKQIIPVIDTSIEVKIQNFLKELNINFSTHKYIKEIKYGYQCDIFIPVQIGIPNKTIIECDGDYWHGNLDIFPVSKLNKKILARRCLDYERTFHLKESGFIIIRLWEHKIKSMTIDDFETILLKKSHHS